MNEKYSALFTPWKIGNVEIKNRIVQPSMGGTSLFGWLEPCHFDKEAAYHILNRAQNNVGLVLPGMQCVRDTMGGRWLYQNKKMFKDLAEWLPEFHKTGSKLFVQLSAGMGRSMAINEIMVKMLQNKAFGAVGKPFLNVDYITASASATPNRWYPECKSRPLTVEEIHEMVDAFAKTAKLLQDAGVDVKAQVADDADKDNNHVGLCHLQRAVVRHLHQPQQGRRQQDTEGRKDQREHRACDGSGGDLTLHALGVSGTIGRADKDAGTEAETVDEEDGQRHQRVGGADGGKGVFANKFAHDDAVGGVISELEQVAQHQRDGKVDQQRRDLAAGHIFGHGECEVLSDL